MIVVIEALLLPGNRGLQGTIARPHEKDTQKVDHFVSAVAPATDVRPDAR